MSASKIFRSSALPGSNVCSGVGTVAEFSKAHVCVIGIGGVGSWAAEALARSGVGKLTLIDADEVCVSNTNRQLHALDGEYGKSKVGVIATRAQAINPAIAARRHRAVSHAVPHWMSCSIAATTWCSMPAMRSGSSSKPSPGVAGASCLLSASARPAVAPIPPRSACATCRVPSTMRCSA